MAARKRTRSENSTRLTEYLGSGKEMCLTELPTLRDCLRYGIYLREMNCKYHYAGREFFQEIVTQVKQRWINANFKFRPPVVSADKTILERLMELWEKANRISRNQVISEKPVARMEEQLDRLFDITKCRCPILSCEDANCPGCPTSSNIQLPPCHIACTCPKEQKIPVLEVPFMMAQRQKIGERSSCMIGSVDQKESRKQTMTYERKEISKKRLEEKRKEENAKKAAMQADQFTEELEEREQMETEEDEASYKRDPNYPADTATGSSMRNMASIRNIAMASIRYGTSSNATAAIANAALLEHGIISKDNTSNVIDAKKVQRAKEALFKELQEKAAMANQERDITCVYFDGRKDWTLKYTQVEGSNQLYPSYQKEEHYSVISEPGGNYLFHFSPPKPDDTATATEQIAKCLVQWMQEYGVDKTIMHIGGDSTNTNSGIWGGVFQFVERMLGRPLNWLLCGLHLNELPLRHLIVNLDGPTSSDTGFTGPLGKALASATELPVKRFSKITIGPDLPVLTEEVRADLSTDQRYGYDMVAAIRSGHVTDRLANPDIGPVNHSRWLTTANRFLRLWVSRHGFTGKDAWHLRLICEYIIGVYYPTWFSYKIRNHWIEGAKICLEQLQLTLGQNEEVVEQVFPYLQSSAWWAHPEMLLQTLLCSEVSEDRCFAVQKIMQVREEGTRGSRGNGAEASIRTRHKVHLNKQATDLRDLIIWDDEQISEPILTRDLPDAAIKTFESCPMKVEPLPVHGQSVERCVQEVTAASNAVHGYARRDGFIRARLAHKELTGGSMRSKKDHAKICS